MPPKSRKRKAASPPPAATTTAPKRKPRPPKPLEPISPPRSRTALVHNPAAPSPPPANPLDPAVTSTENVHILLTSAPLNISASLSHIRDPGAGALLSFIGTTRNTFEDRPVHTLFYDAYVPRALQTLRQVAEEVRARYGVLKVAIAHRLGEVGVGEESVHVCVAAKHRRESYLAGEAALEMVKERAEVWKREVFVDGEGVWRANAEAAGEGEEKKEEDGEVSAAETEEGDMEEDIVEEEAIELEEGGVEPETGEEGDVEDAVVEIGEEDEIRTDDVVVDRDGVLEEEERTIIDDSGVLFGTSSTPNKDQAQKKTPGSKGKRKSGLGFGSIFFSPRR